MKGYKPNKMADVVKMNNGSARVEEYIYIYI
jgi:hypothetical protein